MRITKKEYNSLIENINEEDFLPREGFILISPEDPTKIIKILTDQSNPKDYIQNKIYTIELLIKNRKILSEANISIPEEIIYIEDIPIGYVTKYIEGRTLGKVLNDYSISLKERINILKQVGIILRQMKHIRETTHIKNFYYNDIHEDNFVVTKEGIVYGIDLDSCSILDNIPGIALYPSQLVQSINAQSKYKLSAQLDISDANILPDENLDIYSYIIMILQFMYGQIIYDYNINQIQNYLAFLEYSGANQEFIDCLYRIYDNNVDNINPDYLLDHIEKIYPYSNYYFDKAKCLSKVLR